MNELTLVERLLDEENYYDGAANSIRHEAVVRIEELERIVEKLPVTADGVPVVPGAEVWGFIDSEVVVFSVTLVRLGEIVGAAKDHRGTLAFNQSSFQCYSTRSAAETAKEEVGT